jgi:hypothetical protein
VQIEAVVATACAERLSRIGDRRRQLGATARIAAVMAQRFSELSHVAPKVPPDEGGQRTNANFWVIREYRWVAFRQRPVRLSPLVFLMRLVAL